MIKSMTGFGKAACMVSGKKITIEIRSLNSRQLDLSVRLPQWLREFESEIRSMAAGMIERGKADLSFSEERDGGEGAYVLNQEAAKKHFNEILPLAESLGIEGKEQIFAAILRFPDILKSPEDVPDEALKSSLLNTLGLALVQLDQFRISEGKALWADLLNRTEKISALLVEVEPFEKERIAGIRQKLSTAMAELADKNMADPSRLEQELIFYLEKMDFTEEKVRLKKHCSYFLSTAEEESPGRKLGFIAQEMGREINTLGSKAANANIQQLVVCMKDELEKIKEQLMNVL